MKLYEAGKLNLDDQITDILPWFSMQNYTASLDDFARFVALHLARGRAGGRNLITEAGVREMHRIHGFLSPWSVGYGLGFYLREFTSQPLTSIPLSLI